ncbi:MAG: hypothetical protein WBR35_05030, partial [Anaerolineae bacterium]
PPSEVPGESSLSRLRPPSAVRKMSLTPSVFDCCTKGVRCYVTLVFLTISSLFTTPSCLAAGGASAAGRPSAGGVQSAVFHGRSGYAAAASCGGFLEPWIYDGHIIQHFHAYGS